MDSSSMKLILDFIIETLIIIVTPIAVLLAHKLIAVFTARTGVSIAEQQATIIDDAILKGIAFADEQARKALKAQLPVPTGPTKNATAIDFVIRTLRNQNVPAIGRDYLAELIEARLHMERPFIRSENADV